MNKQETLEVVNQMLDESYKTAKERAAKLLESRDWDFDQFGDRNTFARIVFEVLVNNELNQYKIQKRTRQTIQLEGSLIYENVGI